MALANSKYGSGHGPVWLKNIQCVGTEDAPHHCPHSGFTDTLDSGGGGWWFYRPPCSNHDNDASVFCYGNG